MAEEPDPAMRCCECGHHLVVVLETDHDHPTHITELYCDIDGMNAGEYCSFDGMHATGKTLRSNPELSEAGVLPRNCPQLRHQCAANGPCPNFEWSYIQPNDLIADLERLIESRDSHYFRIDLESILTMIRSIKGSQSDREAETAAREKRPKLTLSKKIADILGLKGSEYMVFGLGRDMVIEVVGEGVTAKTDGGFDAEL